MNRRRTSLLAARCALLALPSIACGAAPVELTKKPEPPAVEPMPPSRAVDPQPEFIVSHKARDAGIVLGDHYGILHDHARFEIDASGRLVGRADSSFDLGDVVLVPEDAGGGLLFAGEAIFRSSAFLGTLTRVANPGVETAQITFGPTQAVALLRSGAVLALSLPDFREVAPSPAGVVVTARAKGGIGGAIVQGGVELGTTDGGKTWSKVVGPSFADPQTGRFNVAGDLEGRDDGVYFFESTRTLRLDASGVVEISAGRASDKRRLDRMFDEIVASGAVLEMDTAGTPTKAIAGLSGTIYVADLATGAVTETDRGVLPAQLECRTTRLASEIVVVCAKGENAAVFSGPIGGKLAMERSFNTAGKFVKGEGDAILFTSACSGLSSKLGVACHRSPGANGAKARWTELDRSADLTDTLPEDPVKLLAWIPTATGAVMLLGGGQGGTLDAVTGARIRAQREASSQLDALFDPKLTKPSVLDDRFTVEADGTIRGFDDRGRGVTISKGGDAIDFSPFTFSTAAHAGRFSLAANGRTLHLSSDWGRSFVEVASAPSASPVQRCSEVGCVLSPWIRLGWGATPPKPAHETPDEPVPSTATSIAPKIPSFVCKSAGAVTRKEIPIDYVSTPGLGASSNKYNPDDATYTAPFLRRILSTSAPTYETGAHRALIAGVIPYVDGLIPSDNIPAKFDRKLAWVDAFDPRSTVQRTTIGLNALLGRAAASGNGAVDLSTSIEDGLAIPVASEGGGLFLMTPSSPAYWVRGAKLSILASPIPSPVSVVEAKPDELAVLAQTTEGEEIFRVSSSSLQRLFTIPPPLALEPGGYNDSLGVDASGNLGVIRISSIDPPTALRPAVLLRDGMAPVALAPWSELLPADNPACSKFEGYRTILALAKSWITYDLQPDVEAAATLRVRWSEQRICLEGAEVAAPYVSLPSATLDSWLSVRFGKDAGAAQLSMTLGAELRDPRTCELSK